MPDFGAAANAVEPVAKHPPAERASTRGRRPSPSAKRQIQQAPIDTCSLREDVRSVFVTQLPFGDRLPEVHFRHKRTPRGNRFANYIIAYRQLVRASHDASEIS